MKHGFTLIETLIYVGILSLLIVFVVVTFYQIIGSQEQNRSRAEIEEETYFLMRKITWGLQGARTIYEPLPGATSSALSVEKAGFSGNPLTFSLSTGTVLLARGSAAAVPLTSSNVRVDDFTVSHLQATAARPAGVDVRLTVLSRLEADARIASTTITSTIYLR